MNESPAPARTVLFTLTGRDRPGVTFALFDALDRPGIRVLDVEQVVIRGRLVLGVLISGGTDEDLPDLLHRVGAVAAGLGMDLDVSTGREGRDAEDRLADRCHVTVLGTPLRPGAVAGLAGRIRTAGANIDRIVRLAGTHITAIEFEVSGAPLDLLRPELNAEAAEHRVDVAVERAGLHRRSKRLIVMDVDSTLIKDEVIELLAGHAGCAAQVAKVTEQAMQGEIDFAGSLRARVALLAGLDASALDEVRAAIRLTPGARTLVRTLKRLDYRFAVVSGGFLQVIDGLVRELGIDYAAANVLEIEDGRLTGRLIGPIVDRAGKADALERFAAEAGIPLGQTVAVGDGANDLDMLAKAGLGIAFNAKPIVRAAADTAVTAPYLDSILYVLGIPREEVEAADAEAAAGR